MRKLWVCLLPVLHITGVVVALAQASPAGEKGI